MATTKKCYIQRWSPYGGRWAVITETFYLSQGQVLSIVVGQRGGVLAGNEGYNYTAVAGGGGGGTFVYTSTNSDVTFFCAAGGGGGATHDEINDQYYHSGYGVSAQTNPYCSGNGNEGYGATGACSKFRGNGAGWLSDGTDTGVNTLNRAGCPTGGHIRLSGWEGRAGRGDNSYNGARNDNNDNMSWALTGFGGFGGGGAMFTPGGVHNPGGGGGYSRGGMRSWTSWGGASRGIAVGHGNYLENGKITITFLL